MPLIPHDVGVNTIRNLCLTTHTIDHELPTLMAWVRAQPYIIVQELLATILRGFESNPNTYTEEQRERIEGALRRELDRRWRISQAVRDDEDKENAPP